MNSLSSPPREIPVAFLNLHVVLQRHILSISSPSSRTRSSTSVELPITPPRGRTSRPQSVAELSRERFNATWREVALVMVVSTTLSVQGTCHRHDSATGRLPSRPWNFNEHFPRPSRCDLREKRPHVEEKSSAPRVSGRAIATRHSRHSADSILQSAISRMS